MKIELPIFYDIEFKEGTKYYYQKSGSAKENLKNKLMEYSKGYCMYTYTYEDYRIELEHSIEETTYTGTCFNPFHCKFNISLASGRLNRNYKNFSKNRLDLVAEGYGCPAEYNCKDICKKLSEIQKKYIEKNQIILMPNKQKFLMDGEEYPKLLFDVYKMEFISSSKDNLWKNLLKSHIDNLKLNVNMDFKNEILAICKIILNYEIKPCDLNNLVSKKSLVISKFLQYLESLNSEEKIKDVVELILEGNSKKLN